MNEARPFKSVLIVDDDETVIKTVRHALIKEGFAVLTASTGEEGLQVAQKQKPHLILLDVILPGIKGREVCKQLKSKTETKDVPVIFLTAKSSEDDIRAEKEAGAVDHLTKPVDPKTLIVALKRALNLK